MPFFFGERICAGKTFAIFMLKVMLVKLLKAFDFRPVDEEEDENKLYNSEFIFPRIKILKRFDELQNIL